MVNYRTQERIKKLLRDKVHDEKKSYYCHCCENKVFKFLSWSSTYENIACPFCKSYPRHRALCIYLEQNPEFNSQNLKVLHFAPHNLTLREKLSVRGNLEQITADLDDPSVDIKVDITDIPYPENTFDIILCSHVLEHVEDDKTAMKELFRVLKPGGWSYLAVPIDKERNITFEDKNIVSPEDRLKHFWQEDHVRLYGLDYKDRLEQAGFIVHIDEYLQKISAQDIENYGLQYREIYHFGMKAKPV